MHIRLIPVTYSCMGEEHTGLWNGPHRYMQAGAEQLLTERGFTVTVEHVELDEPHRDIFQAAISINQKLAQAVQHALAAEQFPLVLSGTCDVSLGIVSCLDRSKSGIVWCDAHGDFNTPETSPSGNFVGMPLAVLTGHCYQDLLTQVNDSTPLPDSQVLMVDVRDLDTLERVSVERAAIPVVAVSDLQSDEQAMASSKLDTFAAHIHDIYLHLDIDVLDPQESPGIDYRTPGGPSVQEMGQAIMTIGSLFHIQAAAITAYNPDLDQEDKTLQAGLHLLVQIAESARSSNRA